MATTDDPPDPLDPSNFWQFLIPAPPFIYNPYELASENPDVRDFIYGPDPNRIY